MSTTLKIALLSTAFGLITMTTAVASDLVRHDPSLSETTETNMSVCRLIKPEELEKKHELAELPNSVFTEMLEMIDEGAEFLDKTSLKEASVHQDLLNQKVLSFRTVKAFGKFLIDVIENINDHQETIATLTEEIAALKEQIASNEASSSAADNLLIKIGEKQEELERIYAENSKLVNLLTRIKEENQTLHVENKNLRQRFIEINTPPSSVIMDYDNEERSTSDFFSSNPDIMKALNLTELNNDQSENLEFASQIELAANSGQISSVQLLDRQLLQENLRLSEAYVQLQEMIKQNKRLQEENARLPDENLKLRSENQRLRQTVAEKEADVKELRQTVAEQEDKIAEREDKIAEQKKTIEELRKEIEDIKRQNDILESYLKMLNPNSNDPVISLIRQTLMYIPNKINEIFQPEDSDETITFLKEENERLKLELNKYTRNIQIVVKNFYDTVKKISPKLEENIYIYLKPEERSQFEKDFNELESFKASILRDVNLLKQFSNNELEKLGLKDTYNSKYLTNQTDLKNFENAFIHQIQDIEKKFHSLKQMDTYQLSDLILQDINRILGDTDMDIKQARQRVTRRIEEVEKLKQEAFKKLKQNAASNPQVHVDEDSSTPSVQLIATPIEGRSRESSFNKF